MNTKNKFLFLVFFCSLGIQAQNFGGVVKIDGLLKRISQPDTFYVVNFWATWCKPCVQELPSFDSLSLETASKPVKILLVSLDFKEELEKKVLPFLEKRQVKASCLLLDETNANEFIDKVNSSWTGAIPATLFKRGDKVLFKEKKIKLKDLHEGLQQLGL